MVSAQSKSASEIAPDSLFSNIYYFLIIIPKKLRYTPLKLSNKWIVYLYSRGYVLPISSYLFLQHSRQIWLMFKLLHWHHHSIFNTWLEYSHGDFIKCKSEGNNVNGREVVKKMFNFYIFVKYIFFSANMIKHSSIHTFNLLMSWIFPQFTHRG